MDTRGTWLLIVVALLAGAGCGPSIEVRGVLPPSPAKVAVLDFDDSDAYKKLRDVTFVGVTGTQQPGRLVARYFRRALGRTPGLAVMRRRRMEDAVGEDALVRSPDDGPGRIAEQLGADAVVLGEVRKYKTTWVLLFFSWATVRFRVVAYDGATGAVLFEGRAKDTDFYGIEERMTIRLCGDLVRRLRVRTGGLRRRSRP